MSGLTEISNARNAEYAALLQTLAETGQCPLDREAFPSELIITTLGGMVLAHNGFPYPNTESHMMIFPERHLADITDLTQPDWAELLGLFKLARTDYGAPTGALFMRYSTEGNYEATGSSIAHPHAQIVVPRIEPATGRVPAYGTPDAAVVTITIG